MAQKMPSTRFIQPTGKSLLMNVPKRNLPEVNLEWKIPEHWNAFERNRARAYCILYSALVALDN